MERKNVSKWQMENVRRIEKSLIALLVFALMIMGMGVGAQQVFAGTEKVDIGYGNERAGSGISYASIVTGSVTVTDIAYYDVWKHIDGTWQFGKKPGSDVSASFEIWVAGALPQGARVTSAAGRYDEGYAGLFSEACVPQASVSVDGNTESTVLYTVQTTLAGEPENLRQDTQSEYTEGYRYYIPVVFEVQYEVEGAAQGGDAGSGGAGDGDAEGDAGSGSQGGSDDGGAEGIEPGGAGDGPALSGEADLYIPYETYEGHTFIADDRSLFEIDGELCGAAHMYREGLASNDFKAFGCQGRVLRESPTSAEVTFNSAGSASVLLTVDMADGTSLTDRESIKVLETPTISVSLGGTQKQNRKQEINAVVAVNPLYPLTELWIEIEEKGSSDDQKVHLAYNMSAKNNDPDAGIAVDANGIEIGAVNTDHIKTRTVKDAGSDDRFTRVKLEFLTKNTETTEMTYRVYARDERGNTDMVTSDFIVAPDQAPQAIIGAEADQIREEGSNIAHVYAEDMSISDGDELERTWYVREEGETEWRTTGESLGKDFNEEAADSEIDGEGKDSEFFGRGILSDSSFGTWQKVMYQKDGVGKLELRLDVRDIWIEGTLSEYVDESEILTGSTTATVDVINIAPVVSLDTYNLKKTYELILADTALYDIDDAEKTAAAEEKELLEKGVSQTYSVIGIKTGDALSSEEFPDSIFKIERGYAFGMESSFLEKNWYMADEDTLYTVDGVWTQNTGITSAKYYSAGAPYTINAYSLIEDCNINHNIDDVNNMQTDGETVNYEGVLKSGEENSQQEKLSIGAIKWSITITSEQLGGAGISSIKGMSQDDAGKYLFFRTNDKSLIYDKRNGAYIGTIAMMLGDDNYAAEGRIYTVKPDGVYAVNMRTGNVTKVYDEDILMKQSYCDSAGSSKRIDNEIHFVSGSGKMLTRVIFDAETESFRFAEMHPSGASYTSTFVILGFGANGDIAIAQDGKSKAYVFDKDGKQLGYFSGWDTSREHDIVPAYKADGNFDYIAALANSFSSDEYYNYYGFNGYLYKKDGSESPIKCSHTREFGSYGASGSGYDAGRTMYAVQVGADVVVNLGNWSTSISDGSPLSRYYYTHFSQVIFDTGAGVATPYAQASPEYGALNAGNVICEYGKVTDDYVISAYSRDSAAYMYDEDVNKQGLVVARLPKTQEQEVEQTTAKFLPDRGAGGTGSAGGSAKRYDSVNVSLYGETLAAEEAGSIIDKYNEELAIIVRTDMDVAIGGEEGNISTISKVYDLLPGTEYFYEFTYIDDFGGGSSGASDKILSDAEVLDKGLIEVEFLTDKISDLNVSDSDADMDNRSEDGIGEGSDNGEKQIKYMVTRIEKEEFLTADNVNTFFSGIGGNAGDGKSRIRDELYYGAELRFGSTDYQMTISDGSTIKFDVPDGEKAVLSFDYSMAADYGGVDQVYVDINGERWYRNSVLSAMSGTYMHPHFLPEGENTIKFAVKGFGWRPKEAYIKIDNLQVIFVETDNESGELDNGVIKTPQEIVSYAGRDMVYVNGSLEEVNIAFDESVEGVFGEKVQLDDGFEFLTNVKEEYKNDLTINIPDGMAAANTAVTVNHSPQESNFLVWNFDGKSFNVHQEKDANYYPLAMPSPFRINTITSEGCIKLSPGRLYNGSAGYDNIEMFLIDKEDWNEEIASGRYFVARDIEDAQNGGLGDIESTGKLFYENETFDGKVRVQISGTGTWAIKDFSLYRVENGRRIYVEDGSVAYGDEYEWAVSGGSIEVGAGGAACGAAGAGAGKTEGAGDGVRVYKKGETIPYNAIYSDYENDPSKKQYWRYAHTPSNDGAHPDAGAILDAPITEFYIDGKYVVEHWQEDNTGNVDYDKLSNVVTMTFYIEGGATAPWITGISTTPAKIEEGDRFSIIVGVDDLEKDTLSLTTEVFEENVLIYTDKKDSITADSRGRYPLISTGALPQAAREGSYTVVCTVRDASGAGIESCSFTVDGGFSGIVEHYPAWEQKRIAYNAANPDRPRSSSTYWAAEAFKLSAVASGNPNSVTVHIAEYPGKKVTLSKLADGSYSGRFYDKSIAAELAKKKQCELTFVFTALYSGGRREALVKVQIDDGNGSGIKIHRVQ